MIVLIDGDVFAYDACKSRAKTDEHGNKYWQTSYEGHGGFSDEENDEYLENSYMNFVKLIAAVKEKFFAENAFIAVKQNDNYRDDIYSEYKANRRKPEALSNPFVPLIRDRAVTQGLAIPAINREADDLLSIWAYQAIASGDPYVIASIDKDLDCIPGTHYNPRKAIVYEVSVVEANQFFYKQLLMGDPTDNIPGIPGIGPAKAASILEGIEDEDELQVVVQLSYQDFFGEDWRNQLLSNGKMLYLQRHANDFFTLDGWVKL